MGQAFSTPVAPLSRAIVPSGLRVALPGVERGTSSGGIAVETVYAYLNLAGVAGIITPTILNNCMLGAVKGTWSYGGGKHNGVDVDPVLIFNQTGLRAQTEYALSPPISCNGTLVESVTRVMEWDEALAVTTADWETAKWVPGETLTGNLMLDYRFEMNRTLGGDAGGTGIDVSSIYFGGDFSILQQQISAGGAITMRPHGGQNMPIANNVRYRIYHLARRLTSWTYILIRNDTTGAFVSASRNVLTVADNVALLLMGNYLLNGNGTHRISSWTPKPGADAVLPSIDIGTITNLSATQTDTGEVTLTGLTHATSLLIERNVGGGSYSTIEAAYDIADRTNASDSFSYVDTGRTDTLLYGYQVTPQVDTLVGTAATDTVTIDDAPFAEPVWTDSIAGASTDATNSNPEFAAMQPIVCGTTGSCTRLRVWIRGYNQPYSLKVALYNSSNVKLGEGAVVAVSGSAGAWAEVILDSAVAVTVTTTYGVGFSFSDGVDAQPGYLDAQPANTAYLDFGVAYAAFPNDPFVTAGNGLTWKFAVGMGVVA